LIKYGFKAKKFGVQQAEHLSTLLALTENANVNSEASNLIIRAIIQMEQRVAVTPADYENYFMKTCGDGTGETCVLSRHIETLRVGGNSGTSGKSLLRGYSHSKEGGMSKDEARDSNLRVYRMRHTLNWDPRATPLLAAHANHISAYVFTATFEYDPEEKVVRLRDKHAGVRIKPPLDAKHRFMPETAEMTMGPGFAQQMMNCHCAHKWEGSDDATQAWLQGPHANFDQAFLAFANGLHHPLPAAVKSQRFGLPGSVSVPLGQLQLPLADAPPDVHKEKMRAANLAAILKGEMDGGEGLGSSGYSVTDIDDAVVVLESAKVRAGDDGDDGDAGVEEPTMEFKEGLDDLYQFPKPPAGFQFSGCGGHLVNQATMLRAIDYVDAHKRKHERGEAEFQPTHQRLFDQPDNRASLGLEQASLGKHVRDVVHRGKQIKVLLMGEAGSGKSYTVMQSVKDLVEAMGMPPDDASEQIRVVAAGGVASQNACGVTAAGFFGMRSKRKKVNGKWVSYYPAPSPVGLKKLERKMRCLRVLILEEVATMGSAMLAHMETVCRLVMRRPNEPWGGLGIIAMGDIDQLPPVLDACPWFPLRPTMAEGERLPLGSWVFHDLLRGDVMFLRNQRRQRVGPGADREDTEFVDALRATADGECDSEHFDALRKLTKRGRGVAAYDAIADDPSCVHLFDRNDAVDKHNAAACRRVGGEDFVANPVLLALAANTHGAECVNTQSAGGVPNAFVFRQGTRVMLRRNLLVVAGLNNGAMGFQIDVGYLDDDRLPHDMPNVVLVAFPRSQCNLPSFDGIVYDDGSGTEHTVVPIGVTTANNFETTKRQVPACASRTGIPLTLACGLTIHKCQGLTLPLVVAHLPEKAYLGMEFVAWSRVRSRETLVIAEDQCALTLERLNRIGCKGRVRKKRQALKGEIKSRLKERAAITMAPYMSGGAVATTPPRRGSIAAAFRTGGGTRGCTGGGGGRGGGFPEGVGGEWHTHDMCTARGGCGGGGGGGGGGGSRGCGRGGSRGRGGRGGCGGCGRGGDRRVGGCGGRHSRRWQQGRGSGRESPRQGQTGPTG